jgi:hypothetical protein
VTDQQPACVATTARMLHYQRGRFDEAEGLLKPCLEAQQRIFSPQHEAVLTTSRLLKELAEVRASGSSRGR